MTTAPVRILVVDDSAFVRKVVREVLANSGVEVVGTARDGEEALEAVERLEPDLVISDLRMPNVDGVEFVRRQMARRPLPILILSAAAQDAEEVIEALNAGAVDVVQKPTALATDALRTVQQELVGKIRLLVRPGGLIPPVPVPVQPVRVASAPAQRADVVVLGISTGGPQALRRLIPSLPADFPVPIAIVLHMPVGYTAMYAAKLDEIASLRVKEAAEGDVLRPGLVLIAAAGRHLAFKRQSNGDVMAELPLQPLDKLHRPSVDVLFRSAAEVYGQRVLAVVMTGMGNDGCEGAAWVKARGGTVLTEAEKSCVIYGMPRSVEEAGLSDKQVTLDEMAQAVISHL